MFVKKDCYSCTGCYSKRRHCTFIYLKKDNNGKKYIKMKEDHYHICQLFNFDEIRFPMVQLNEGEYEIHKNGKNYAEILVFIPNSKQYFYFKKNNKSYFCSSCHSLGISVQANIVRDKSGKEYVTAEIDHQCKPLKYIRSITDFTKDENGNLFTYVDDIANYKFIRRPGGLYECSKSGCNTIATIWVGKNKKEYIRISSNHLH